MDKDKIIQEYYSDMAKLHHENILFRLEVKELNQKIIELKKEINELKGVDDVQSTK